MTDKPRVSLPAIFSVFFRIGLMSFGGGLSGWIYREVVDRKAWLDDKAFLSGMALCQILPGANVTNLAVYIGQQLRGPPGAAVAFLALVAGPFLIVIAMMSLYEGMTGARWSSAALDGVAAAAVGLMLMVAVRAVRHAGRGIVAVLVVAGTFVSAGVLQWPLVPVALCAGAISVAASWPRKDTRA